MNQEEFARELGYGDKNKPGVPFIWAQAGAKKSWATCVGRPIVAYKKDLLGGTILMRGKTKFYCFAILRTGMNWGGYDYKMTRIDYAPIMAKALNILESEGVIVDKVLFEEYKNKRILEAI